MKVVVDTNIVFSAILNSASNIGKVLIHYGRYFEFYSCNFLRDEINDHKRKLLKLTRLKEEELEELITLSTKHIRFINEQIIPQRNWNFAIEKLHDLDQDDLPFVALTHQLKAKLWTGDKKLIKGLDQKGYNRFITTQELLSKLKKK